MGRLFEEEHGLKRGRQRLRQLAQLGKRYEQEHGLAAKPRKSRPRRAKAWRDFVQALSHVVKPAYRERLERLAAEMNRSPDRPGAA